MIDTRPASLIRLEAINVEICNASGAGKGNATTTEVRTAVTEARADTPRSVRGGHAFIDGIAAALTRALIAAAKEIRS
jgi:hypothetical protein